MIFPLGVSFCMLIGEENKNWSLLDTVVLMISVTTLINGIDTAMVVITQYSAHDDRTLKTCLQSVNSLALGVKVVHQVHVASYRFE